MLSGINDLTTNYGRLSSVLGETDMANFQANVFLTNDYERYRVQSRFITCSEISMLCSGTGPRIFTETMNFVSVYPNYLPVPRVFGYISSINWRNSNHQGVVLTIW